MRALAKPQSAPSFGSRARTPTTGEPASWQRHERYLVRFPRTAPRPPVCAHLPICQQPFANTQDISLVILCVSFHRLPFPVPVGDLPFALIPSFLRHFSPSPCELPAAERIQLTDGHTPSATGFIVNPCLLLSTFN